MKLYTYFRSSAAYRVRIALNLKGLDCEYVYVNLKEGEQQGDSYKGINPSGLVPTFEDGDLTLYQSPAILEYLDEKYSALTLLPGDMAKRAIVRSLAALVGCDIHPLNNLRILKYMAEHHGCSEGDKTAWYHHWVHEGFKAYEAQLVETAGMYSFGNKVTMADLYLIPQVYNAKRFEVDLSAYPKILQVDENCLNLDAFRDATPEAQGDCPAELKVV